MKFRVALLLDVSHYLSYCFAPLLLIAVLLLVWGCGMTARLGRLPETSKLETSLQPEISTRDDVLKVLGEPRNSGGAMLPFHDSPRIMWVYYYEEGTINDSRRIFLFVFFKKDHYDGYLWFSSLPGMGHGSP